MEGDLEGEDIEQDQLQSSIRGSFRAIWFNFIESLKQSENIHIR